MSEPLVNNYPTSANDAVSNSVPTNNASTTLTADIGASDVSIPLANAALFANQGIGTLIDDLDNPTQVEIIKWDSKSGSNLILSDVSLRGVDGTTAASFSSGAYFEARPTALHYAYLVDRLDTIEGKLDLGPTIPWATISKSGSSLADLATRSASDLSSGTLPLARLSGITTNELSPTAGITNGQLAGSITEAKFLFSDNTTGDATSSAHGFLPKLSGSVSDVLRGDGTFGASSGSGTVSSGTVGRLAVYTGSTTVGGAAGIEYQSGASPNLTITAQNDAHTALLVQAASASYSAVPFKAQIAGGGWPTISFDPTYAGGNSYIWELTGAANDPFPIMGVVGVDNADGTGGAEIAALMPTSVFRIQAKGTGYSGANLFSVSSSALLRSNSAGGLIFLSQHATASTIFANGGTALTDEKLRITPSSGIQASADFVSKTAAGVSLGSATLPFKYLFLGGDSGTPGTNNFKLTGTATAARTITFPDASITVARTDAAQTFTGVQTMTTPSFTTGFTIGGTAATGTIPRGNGTNFVASAFTMAAPGTSGNVLTSDGTNWTSAAPAGGGITVGTTTITSGTATRLLYETSGNVVGEVSGVTSDGTNVTAGSGNLRATSPRITTDVSDSNGNEVFKITATGSAVNEFTIANAATGSSPTITASGGDTDVGINFTGKGIGGFVFTSGVTTGTGATAGIRGLFNSLTTGIGTDISSSSITTGSLLKLTSTSTAGDGFSGLNIAISGANASTAKTVTGATISVTNTNATSGTNVALTLTASGATTANVALNVTAGQVRVPDGSAGAPAYSFTSAPTATGIFVESAHLVFMQASTERFRINAFGIDLGANPISGGSSASVGDIRMIRAASGTWRMSAGSNGAGSLILGTSAGAIGTSGAGVLAFTLSTAPSTSPTDTVQLWSADAVAGAHNLYSRNEAGDINRMTGLTKRVSTQFDKTSDTTLANITGLVHDVESSRSYAFIATLFTTANVAGGVKFAISGTATATSVIYEAEVNNAGTILAPGTARATALATTVGDSTTATAAMVIIRGTIVVSNGGTLAPQFAQNASNGSASSVLVNSTFQLIPIS